jgi:hypothetical protein
MQVTLRKGRYGSWRAGLVGLCALIAVAPAHAVSITGILLYSTDDFGNPNGYETLNSDNFQAQTWVTLFRQGQPYHGLGVAPGLPPKSIEAKLLNFPNFTVDLPLDEGENYFTLFAEPGELTATDDYQRFLINIYFDGDQEKPGITVLFPRYSEPDGTAVAEARPNDDQMYALAVPQKVVAQPQNYYDDGIYRVSILRASLLSPERASISADRVSKFVPSPGGDPSDWIGTLTVSVEPSESFGPGGGAPFASGGSGGSGRTGGVGSDVQPRPGSAGYLPPPVGGQPQAQGDLGETSSGGGGAESATPGQFWHQGGKDKDDESADLTPTPEDVAGALREWLKEEAALTPTSGTPGSTGTPAATPTPASKTPAQTATQTNTPPNTPTPVLTGTQSPATKGQQADGGVKQG